MLSPFGKLVRKHRIDKGMTLNEMAELSGRSAAFISAVETARKQIPKELPEQVAEVLELNADETAELTQAAEISKQEFKIKLPKNATQEDQELVAMFARQFPTISEEEKENIKRILAGRSG